MASTHLISTNDLILRQQINAIAQVKLFAVINYGRAKLAETRLDPVLGVREKEPDKRSPTILVPVQSVPSWPRSQWC